MAASKSPSKSVIGPSKADISWMMRFIARYGPMPTPSSTAMPIRTYMSAVS